jgi:hypothetical protein
VEPNVPAPLLRRIGEGRQRAFAESAFAKGMALAAWPS